MSQEVPDKCKGCPNLKGLEYELRLNMGVIALNDAILVQVLEAKPETAQVSEEEIEKRRVEVEESLESSKMVLVGIERRAINYTNHCDNGVQVDPSSHPSYPIYQCGSTYKD